MKLYFEDGSSIAVRPSGTEPKIKIYIGVVADSLEAAKAKPQVLFSTLKSYLGL